MVDDEPHILRAFKNFLTNENFKMTGVKIISEAEEILQHIKMDLLIVNIEEKDNSTYSVIKKLRQESPDLPIIAVSAYTELQYRECFKELAFNSFLPKPIDIYSLRQAVHASLD